MALKESPVREQNLLPKCFQLGALHNDHHNPFLEAGACLFGDEIVIYDVDGTIINIEHRLKYLTQKPKTDWKRFLAEIGNDTCYEHIKEMVVEDFISGKTVCLVTARNEGQAPETIAQMQQFGVPYHYLFMRKKGDYRCDTIVKEEILRLLPKEKILYVVEDRPRVIDMWRQNGLKVIAVNTAPDYDYTNAATAEDCE